MLNIVPASNWWLRSANSNNVNYFGYVSTDGWVSNNNSANNSYAVALGFCLDRPSNLNVNADDRKKECITLALSVNFSLDNTSYYYTYRVYKRGICEMILDYKSLFSFKHLYEAYQECRKGVSWKPSTQKFIAIAPLQIYKLWKKLTTRKWKSKVSYEFNIFERGKLRHIRATSMAERIVQRCLCDYCLLPIFTKTLIYDNGASLKGKGYTFSIRRCTQHLQEHYRKYGANGYILQYDFKGFFDSIDHDKIMSIVKKKINSQEIISVIQSVVNSSGDIGLGLGSHISQILALTAANKLDHFMKEKLHIRGYGRYMDDGYLISDSKEKLRNCLVEIRKICDELKLTLNEKKTHITKLSRGFTFLKVKFSLTETGRVIRRISRASVTRMRRKLEKLSKTLSLHDFRQSYQSWRAYVSKLNSWKTIKRMDLLYNRLTAQISRQTT